jgi:thiol-disulfide isomerase/thioredoxin
MVELVVVGLVAGSDSTATTLVNCGPAPDFTGITAWLNTPGGKPLSLKDLRGKVVLVDFWTCSCINCQRSLPHVETWYQQYAKDGRPGVASVTAMSPIDAFIDQLPKVELHLHLVGSASELTVLELAGRHPDGQVPASAAELVSF